MEQEFNLRYLKKGFKYKGKNFYFTGSISKTLNVFGFTGRLLPSPGSYSAHERNR